MKAQTRQALLALNRRFYDLRGQAFAATRSQPWSGWVQAHAFFPDNADVVDLGCGHGRLASFLAEVETRRPRSYLGIDQSVRMLALARAREWPQWVHFEHADVLGHPLASAMGERKRDVICLFGVLHHVPGLDERLALVDAALSGLRPGGRLIVSLWRFDESPRFATRCLDPAQLGLDLNEHDLEPGDRLLGFGSGASPPRYCHFPNEPEVRALITRPHARLLDRYRPSSGDTLNEYVVLEHVPP